MTDAQITVYTTPTCPDCRALKAWLNEKEIAFVEKDLSAPEVMTEAKALSGVRVAPITVVGDRIFYGTFASQKPDMEKALGLERRA